MGITASIADRRKVLHDFDVPLTRRRDIWLLSIAVLVAVGLVGVLVIGTSGSGAPGAVTGTGASVTPEMGPVHYCVNIFRSTDLSVYGPEDLERVAQELNGRPRKALGWDTPAECPSDLLLTAK